MKKCVISYANGIYVKGLRRLEQSIRTTNPDVDIIFWYDNLPPDSPTHEDSPCAFKIFAFIEAKKRGYDIALWIDSTGIVIRDLKPIFSHISKKGYYFIGQYIAPVGEWSSDATLLKFGITREKSFEIPEILTFAIGLNFHDSKAIEFLERYKEKSLDGISFRGAPKEIPLSKTLLNTEFSISKDKRVLGHRWEQTSASIIVYEMKLTQTLFGTYDIIGHAKKGNRYSTCIPYDTIIIQNRDIRGEKMLNHIDRYSNIKNPYKKALYIIKSYILYKIRRAKNYTRILLNRKFKNKNFDFL